MNLRQLEILRAVIHAGTTVGAASTLHMSQPAISNAIKAMERSLGFALFSRVHNRLVPTREATVLLNQAEPMFTIQEMVEQTARHLRDGTMGHINIVATAEPSDSLLPQVLTRFIKQHPDVRVSMETLRLDNVLEYVETGAADIGFAIEPYARPTLKYIPLSVLDIVCLCPADSPLCQLPYVTPNHLKDVPLINAAGMNTAQSTSAMAISAPPTSSMVRCAASFGESPARSCRSTFSTTTIASSTTMPMASTRPNSDRLFSE